MACDLRDTCNDWSPSQERKRRSVRGREGDRLLNEQKFRTVAQVGHKINPLLWINIGKICLLVSFISLNCGETMGPGSFTSPHLLLDFNALPRSCFSSVSLD